MLLPVARSDGRKEGTTDPRRGEKQEKEVTRTSRGGKEKLSDEKGKSSRSRARARREEKNAI